MLPYSLEAGFIAGNIRYALARRGRAPAIADALIAAAAIEVGAPLVTSNVRDFVSDGLEMIEPRVDRAV